MRSTKPAAAVRRRRRLLRRERPRRRPRSNRDPDPFHNPGTRAMPAPSLSDIAAMLNIPSPAGSDRPVRGVASLPAATEQDIAFLSSEKYLPDLARTRAAAVVVPKRLKLPPNHGKSVLLVDDADLAVA